MILGLCGRKSAPRRLSAVCDVLSWDEGQPLSAASHTPPFPFLSPLDIQVNRTGAPCARDWPSEISFREVKNRSIMQNAYHHQFSNKNINTRKKQ